MFQARGNKVRRDVCGLWSLTPSAMTRPGEGRNLPPRTWHFPENNGQNSPITLNISSESWSNPYTVFRWGQTNFIFIFSWVLQKRNRVLVDLEDRKRLVQGQPAKGLDSSWASYTIGPLPPETHFFTLQDIVQVLLLTSLHLVSFASNVNVCGVNQPSNQEERLIMFFAHYFCVCFFGHSFNDSKRWIFKNVVSLRWANWFNKINKLSIGH